MWSATWNVASMITPGGIDGNFEGADTVATEVGPLVAGSSGTIPTVPLTFFSYPTPVSELWFSTPPVPEDGTGTITVIMAKGTAFITTFPDVPAPYPVGV